MRGDQGEIASWRLGGGIGRRQNPRLTYVLVDLLLLTRGKRRWVISGTYLIDDLFCLK